MRRLELHPVDPTAAEIRVQPFDELAHAAVHRVARVALRHDHEVGVELVTGLNRGVVALDGRLARDHLDTG